MFRIYALVIIIGILGAVGFGAKYYYDTTQNTIKTLRENNAQLKSAVETVEESNKMLKEDFAKMSELNNQLQKDLVKAEAYSDELRSKFSRLDLVQDALKDAKNLEGRMNGATAKLWREFMANSGSDVERPLPKWLHESDAGNGTDKGNEGGKDSNRNSSETETTTTN